MKKRMGIIFVLTGCILTAIMLSFRWEQNKDGVTRAEAAKLFSLLFAAQEQKEESGESPFSDVGKEDPDYAYIYDAFERNLFAIDETKKAFEKDKFFTYEDYGQVALQLGLTVDDFSFSHKSKRAMTPQHFYKMYDALRVLYKDSARVKKKYALLYSYNEKKKELVTSAGTYTKVEKEMKKKVGKVICYYSCEGEFLQYLSLSNRSITVKNVWCRAVQNEKLTIFAKQNTVTLPVTNAANDAAGHVVDVTIANQQVQSVTKKEATVNGKVVSVTKDSISLEKKTYKRSSTLPVYVTYEGIKELSSLAALMSYKSVHLVLEQEQVVAVIIPASEQTTMLRVLLNTTGFQSKFHEQITVTADTAFSVSQGEKKGSYQKGEEITFLPGDVALNERIRIEPKAQEGRLIVKSIERAYGNPSYRGSLEIAKTEEGMVLVNEVGVEPYLYAVVPSEMPVQYGSEALKLQSVCARSFAFSQLHDPSFLAYGAHLDDSVNSQVYNNTKECDESILAVDSTCGQVLYDGGSLVTTYFFSTSCGYTGNSSDVWISNAAPPSYLTGKLQASEGGTLDLKDETTFRTFIDHTNAYDFFEKEEPWFRWTVAMSKKQIQALVEKNLSSVSRYVSVKQDDGNYKQQEIASIGSLKDIKVGERSSSGVLKSLILVGSKAQIMVTSEYGIRKLLGDGTIPITVNGGGTLNQTMLPSGYFYFDIIKTKNGKIKTVTYHGGGYGHGVGMSQNGAKTMGEKGYTYEQMLSYFFEGTTLHNMYEHQSGR